MRIEVEEEVDGRWIALRVLADRLDQVSANTFPIRVIASGFRTSSDHAARPSREALPAGRRQDSRGQRIGAGCHSRLRTKCAAADQWVARRVHRGHVKVGGDGGHG